MLSWTIQMLCHKHHSWERYGSSETTSHTSMIKITNRLTPSPGTWRSFTTSLIRNLYWIMIIHTFQSIFLWFGIIIIHKKWYNEDLADPRQEIRCYHAHGTTVVTEHDHDTPKFMLQLIPELMMMVRQPTIHVFNDRFFLNHARTTQMIIIQHDMYS